jgi:hypothetical protein
MAVTPIITISVDTTNGNLSCTPTNSLSLPEISAILTHFAGLATQTNTTNIQQGAFQSIVSKFVVPVVEDVVDAAITKL